MKQLKRFAIAAMMALPMMLLASCSEVNSKMNAAADAVDSGNYAEAQNLADEVMNKHWSELDIYDKCDLAAVYFVLFGDYDEANYDKLRRCWDSAMSEDRATATDYINSQLEGGSRLSRRPLSYMRQWTTWRRCLATMTTTMTTKPYNHE